MKNTSQNILLSIAHVRSLKEGIFNFFVTIFSAILGYFQLTIIENKNLFIAILIVVIGDFIFGSAYAIKRNIWETQKAMKVIYYVFAYSIIVFVVLAIEKAHSSAFFLSDAIIMPILLFQTISMLKNASLLGWIPKGALLEILKKIDNYKAAVPVNEIPVEEPINPT